MINNQGRPYIAIELYDNHVVAVWMHGIDPSTVDILELRDFPIDSRIIHSDIRGIHAEEVDHLDDVDDTDRSNWAYDIKQLLDGDTND